MVDVPVVGVPVIVVSPELALTVVLPLPVAEGSVDSVSAQASTLVVTTHKLCMAVNKQASAGLSMPALPRPRPGGGLTRGPRRASAGGSRGSSR